MRNQPHLNVIASQPTPKTWGEGFIRGHEDGYERGRRDVGFERAVIGFLIGAALAGFLALALT